MRFAVGISYEGTAYCGWQAQDHSVSVQEMVEKAISSVAASLIQVRCAGRTDAGVHATMQVVSYDSDAKRSLDQWLLGINANLPKDIRVQWVREVPEDFHARFSAVERSYCYIIDNVKIAPCFLRHLVTWYRKPLNIEAMHQAAQVLIGEHDFSSFQASDCQSKTSIRTMKSVRVFQQNKLIVIGLTANAFLHHMVRNIVGTLLKVGVGEESVEWFSEVLQKKDRTKAGITAPAEGLYLTGVQYPEQYQLPRESLVPPILSL